MSLTKDIKSFVEGRSSAKALYERVVADTSAESLFDGFVAKPYTNDGSLYLYIISQDYDKPATTVNLQDVLAKFLKWKDIDYSQDTTALQEYELILKVSPPWVYLSEQYIKKLHEKIKGTDAKQARSIIKGEIQNDFTYLNKPPKWLQSPAWLFDDERPLIFVGQLGLGTLKHDTSQLYVFIDPNDDTTRSIVQTA